MKKTAAIFALAALAGCSQQDSGISDPLDLMRQFQLRNLMMETMVLGQRTGEYTFFPNNDTRLLDRPGSSFDLVIKIDETNKMKDKKHYLCSNFRVLILTMDKNGDYLLPYQRATEGTTEGGLTIFQNLDKILPDFTPRTLLNLPSMIADANDPARPYYLSDSKTEICAMVSPAP